jgi:hypothetical protein
MGLQGQRLKAGCLWQYAEKDISTADGGRALCDMRANPNTPATVSRYAAKRSGVLWHGVEGAEGPSFAVLPADIITSLLKKVGGMSLQKILLPNFQSLGSRERVSFCARSPPQQNARACPCGD